MAAGEVSVSSLWWSLNVGTRLLVSCNLLIMPLCCHTTTSHSGTSIQLLLVFSSGSFDRHLFFCLPTDLLLPASRRSSPALRKQTTRSPQRADTGQTLERSIYIHRDFRLICCFDISINNLTRPVLALSFVAKLQSQAS